jgi:hypothetical protein
MTSTSEITTVSRADMKGLVNLLRTQRTRRLDLITTAPAMRYEGGHLVVDADAPPVLTHDGVTSVGGYYHPTSVFEEGLGSTFSVPPSYLRKLREEGRIELLDQNINHYLQGSADGVNPPDGRKFLLRAFTGTDTGGGVARALLSDRYRTVDNLDVLVSVLAGMADAGLGPSNIGRCDLTERRMYVQVQCPEVSVLAPELLAGYRSPFTGQSGNDIPQVFAGFVVGNSEVGAASTSITPRIVFRVCGNGMTITRDAMRSIHIGVKRQEGVVQYAADTQEQELRLVTLKARDAVRTFLNPEYVAGLLRGMAEDAAVEVKRPEATVKAVVQAAGVPRALEDDVLGMFIKGGQLTAGGVMQAVTAVAQQQDNAETAYELEGLAGDVLAHAARIAAREE